MFCYMEVSRKLTVLQLAYANALTFNLVVTVVSVLKLPQDAWHLVWLSHCPEKLGIQVT